ncbi:MAG TPA: permease-like cell division protein FtsX [Candidatus Peribacteraceae bacterium]|nr:permease-like cell division protein FtsX [Candidatus Peribacteraceae bacterium]
MKSSVQSSVALRRGFRKGFLLLKREGNWATTLTLLTSVLVLVQMLIMSVLAIYAVGSILSSRAGLRIEVLPTASSADIQNFFAAVHGQPDVSSVQYITKEQAYEQERKSDPALVSFLDQYKIENPFPDTFAVTLTSLATYDSFRQFLEDPQWKSVISPSFLSETNSQEQQIQTLLQVSAAIRSVTFLFLFVAFAVLLFLILELVSRSVRERGKELFLESMLGAPVLSVLLPIMTEMALLLIFSTLIATVIIIAFAMSLPFFIPALANQAPFNAFANEMQPLMLTVFPWIVLLEICLMPALSYVGTFLGAGKKILSPMEFLK